MATPRKTPGASAVNLAIVANDLDHVKADVADIKTVLGQMSNNLQGITRIEERQLSVVASLERGDKVHQSHEKRIATIETEMPQLRELRTDVRNGIRAGVTMLFAGILSLVGGVYAERFIPKQYVSTLVSNPNPVPPHANPQ